ncbi:aminotransferase class V-fold PLP-dependent enzyme [Fodinisporobacter ferrooxydans]|uniref:Aminotransferase class V-fold PLP-dependent enzyme n=1 Tax=Fodinisporobacter ferrooxydans TaxID=2901836 RepID=A0ABY4CGC8_9BACL|nr:aminotransferase class V-fold PLP-dependent enzyme [Alicyclobacillaceae bacterium MYW30-H2]
MGRLERYFKPFRNQTIGYHHTFVSPNGKKRMIYADWTASGRLYLPIEERISQVFGPLVGNTHSEASLTGAAMTNAYHEALQIIKHHVHANDHDVILNAGNGTTAVINKMQRILGLRVHEKFLGQVRLQEKPIVFLTHMEHHSNHISWEETIADVEIIQPTPNGLVDLKHFQYLLEKYKNRTVKIGSFTACSNVTGIQTPYHTMAKMLHEHGGICFVDFAASAPYVKIDMHPASPLEKLDGIFFSPHKFLGGPGTSGVMVFDSSLYKNTIPDQPGGGTVEFTDPWGGKLYASAIEMREDGGTPGFLQVIRTALCIRLKEAMGIENIEKREKELLHLLIKGMREIPGITVLGGHLEDRHGIVSFQAKDIHYNLFAKLLNDRFGIQVRGGCACAGPYGHYLLRLSRLQSKQIKAAIAAGDLSTKPGWVRISLHPIMTDKDVQTIVEGIAETVKNGNKWKEEYRYSAKTNEFTYVRQQTNQPMIEKMFRL